MWSLWMKLPLWCELYLWHPFLAIFLGVLLSFCGGMDAFHFFGSRISGCILFTMIRSKIVVIFHFENGDQEI